MFSHPFRKDYNSTSLPDTDQQEVISAPQSAAQAAGEKIRCDKEQFVSDCVAALREQTANLCEEMHSSISICETRVHQKTLNPLARFIDQFKQMNFANDRVMEEQLENVRKGLLTKTAEEYRDSQTARARLVNGLSQLADKARELSKAAATQLVQRFGEMGRESSLWLLKTDQSFNQQLLRRLRLPQPVRERF